MSVSNTFTKEEYYPSHLLAQQLNNKASVLLTLGKYDEGIRILTKALKLTDLEMKRRRAAKKQVAPCNCKACSLESCLTITIDDDDDDQKPRDKQHQTSAGLVSSSETNDSHRHLQDGETQGNYYANNCTSCDDEMEECDDDQYQSSSSSSSPAASFRIATAHDLPHQAVVVESSSTTTDDRASELKGFVYQRPLLVPQKFIEERHYMGITLSLIILLNLALAHHLKALAALVVPPSHHLKVMNHRKTLKVLEQALQLYELAYQLNVDHVRQAQQQQPSSQGSSSMTTNSNDDCDDDYSDANNDTRRSLGSLRFTMIVSNNLGEIHRFLRMIMRAMYVEFNRIFVIELVMDIHSDK